MMKRSVGYRKGWIYSALVRILLFAGICKN